MEPLKKSAINKDNFSVASNVEENINLDYSADNYEEDADLIRLAEERIVNDSGIRISHEDFWREFGITDKDIEDIDEVEIE